MQVELMEGRGFLLADNNDQGVNSRDKKIEPAVPDEKEEDIHADKQEQKNEQVPDNVNPGLCSALFVCL